MDIRFRKETGIFKVVDGISFDLFKGETLAIVGESGSGKTTLALSIVRALSSPPLHSVSGEILFHGKNLLRFSEKEMNAIRGKKITMVFQDPSAALNPVYTIGYQLQEVIDYHFDLDEEESYNKILKALSEVKLPDPEIIFDKYPHELSGGQRQRVMIAMAVLPEPEVLIADEPTTALDVTIQKEILLLLKDIQKTRGLSLLLITHDIGIVADSADDIIVMYAAQSVEIGSKKDVLLEPKHPYTQALLQSLPKIGAELLPIKGSVPSLDHLPEGCHFHPRCPFAWDRCKKGDVPLFISGSQKVRCWLYDPSES